MRLLLERCALAVLFVADLMQLSARHPTAVLPRLQCRDCHMLGILRFDCIQ